MSKEKADIFNQIHARYQSGDDLKLETHFKIQFFFLSPLRTIDFSKREFSIREHRAGSPLRGNLDDNARTVASSLSEPKS